MNERPIHNFSEEPVSEEFLNVLARLKNGEEVQLSEINNIYEIRLANACLAGLKPTIEIEGREIIQENVYNRLQKMGSAVTQSDGTVLLKGEVRREKRLDIVIGLPGAGKSSAVAEPISELFESRIIDCDEAKKKLSGYDEGRGTQAVHLESQTISNKQLKAALKKGENITYPRVGASYDAMKTVIDDAKEASYKVYVHYNELDRNKALGRMLDRFLTTGRYLKPELITDVGDKIDKTFEKLKSSGLLDGYSKWNNDVEFGERPKLCEHSASCDDVAEALSTPKKPISVKEKAELHDAVIEKLTARVEKLEADLRTVKAQLDKAQAQLNKTSNICHHLPKEFQEQFVQKRDELYPKYDPARGYSIDNVPHKPPGDKPGSSGTKR